MKKIILSIGSIFAALTATSVLAQGHYAYHDRYDEPGYTGFYMGASAGSLIYKEEGLNTLSPTIIELRIGQQFSPFVAIEGRLGTGINSDESHGFKVDAEAVYGGYVKGILPFSPWVSGYGLAGIGGVQLHRNYPDFHSNDAGLSFGAGMEFKVGGGASLNLEWLRLTTGSNQGFYDYTADQLTFGVNWRW